MKIISMGRLGVLSYENVPLNCAAVYCATYTKYDYWPQNGLGNFPSDN